MSASRSKPGTGSAGGEEHSLDLAGDLEFSADALLLRQNRHHARVIDVERCLLREGGQQELVVLRKLIGVLPVQHRHDAKHLATENEGHQEHRMASHRIDDAAHQDSCFGCIADAERRLLGRHLSDNTLAEGKALAERDPRQLLPPAHQVRRRHIAVERREGAFHRAHLQLAGPGIDQEDRPGSRSGGLHRGGGEKA